MADKKDWMERLKDERGELRLKLDKLEAFLDRLKSGAVKIEDQPQQYALLLMQREVMMYYLIILERRIDVAEPHPYLKSDFAEALWR